MAGDTFLDVIGAGVAPAPSRGSAAKPRSRVVTAFAPLAVTLAVLAVVALTGLSRRSGLPEAVEPYAYGYFLDRYPLFAFALVYAAARLVAVAVGPGPAGLARRIVFALPGLAVLALAGLYPTFGGLILRGGFSTGGMAFLTGQPLWLAYTLGAGIAAMMVGGILGAFGLAANGSLRPRLRRIGAGALAFLLLWFGAVLIGLGRDIGVGPWPARALTAPEAGLAALLLILSGLPHTLFHALRDRAARA